MATVLRLEAPVVIEGEDVPVLHLEVVVTLLRLGVAVIIQGEEAAVRGDLIM